MGGGSNCQGMQFEAGNVYGGILIIARGFHSGTPRLILQHCGAGYCFL